MKKQVIFYLIILVSLLIICSSCTNLEKLTGLEDKSTEELITELKSEYSQSKILYSNFLGECYFYSNNDFTKLNSSLGNYIYNYTYIKDLNYSNFENLSINEKELINSDFMALILELQSFNLKFNNSIQVCKDTTKNIKNFYCDYDTENGPLLTTSVGTNIDPFTYSTRAFIVPMGSLEYGSDVEQSLLLGRCGSTGSIGYTTDSPNYAIEFCAHISYFIENGWSGKILELYVFDSEKGYVFEGTNQISEIETYHNPQEFQKILIFVPNIDEDWLVDYEYMSPFICDNEENCKTYLETIKIDLEEQRKKVDPAEIEWNYCKNWIQEVAWGKDCSYSSGKYEGYSCSDLVFYTGLLEFYDGTCCEWYKEKNPDSISWFECKELEKPELIIEQEESNIDEQNINLITNKAVGKSDQTICYELSNEDSINQCLFNFVTAKAHSNEKEYDLNLFDICEPLPNKYSCYWVIGYTGFDKEGCLNLPANTSTRVSYISSGRSTGRDATIEECLKLFEANIN